jgi:hypothetical protein
VNAPEFRDGEDRLGGSRVTELHCSAAEGLRVEQVAVDDQGVSYSDPAGASRRLDWPDLRGVVIVTPADAADDVLWCLWGYDDALSVPQTAHGADELICRLQELPGFDNQAVVAAMGCERLAEFKCWERMD